jgi:hypothetical protein
MFRAGRNERHMCGGGGGGGRPPTKSGGGGGGPPPPRGPSSQVGVNLVERFTKDTTKTPELLAQGFRMVAADGFEPSTFGL